MARDASGLRCPGSPPPPAAPGRTLLRAGSELWANLGARANESEREGRRSERKSSQPREAAALGGVACTFHLKADLLQLAASGRIANLILPRDLSAPSGPNSVPLAAAAAAATQATAAAAPPTSGRWGCETTLHVPGPAHPQKRGFRGLFEYLPPMPPRRPHPSSSSSPKPCRNTPLAGMTNVFFKPIPLPSQRPLQRKPRTSSFRNSFPSGKVGVRELCISGPFTFPKRQTNDPQDDPHRRGSDLPGITLSYTLTSKKEKKKIKA